MRFDLVVLDFDGTFTDAEAEAGPFLRAYRQAAEAWLEARGVVDAAGAWEAEGARLEAAPEAYGWRWEGRIVAPGGVDPYLRASVIMSALLDAHSLLPEPAPRRGLLQRLYASCYVASKTVFRPDARAVVEALLASPATVAVVTNSATDAVREKLATLAPRGQEHLRVYGDAEKYVVTPAEPPDGRFDGLPDTVAAPGLDRPVFLRRGRYYETLRALWETTGTTPERTLVAGDIYELDLALPAALGAAVQLVGKARTMSYERAAVRALERGRDDDRLSALLERVGLSAPASAASA
ncbi:MAG: HAD family hydrolase [Myxococcota bacterium]